MMKNIKNIALELVPSEPDKLLRIAQAALEYEAIYKINIPEIRSIEIKSFESAMHLLKNGIDVVPHFRTIDRDIPTMEKMLGQLVDAGLKEVLFISGDIPSDFGFISSNITPIKMVKKLKKVFPNLKFFAGMDPYRQSMKAELRYCSDKLEHGFDGFYTQPFFHAEHLKMYLDHLEGEVYVGISPVTSKSSMNYWETVNNVVFPKDFIPEIEYNCKLDKELLNIAAEYNHSAYLMPITISSKKYLEALYK